MFSRDTQHRQSLLKNGVYFLMMHGHITTTRPKAKEFKRWADKLLHKAQAGTLAARRDLHSFFGKRDVVNTMVDRIAPLFKDRVSGFSRMTVIGKRRGDNTEMVKLELAIMPTGLGSLKNPAPKKQEVKKATTKPAAKPATKKAVAKPLAKKPAAKKPVTKKTTTKKTK